MSSAYLTRVKTRARQYISLRRNYVAERNKSVQVSQFLTNNFSSVVEKNRVLEGKQISMGLYVVRRCQSPWLAVCSF